MVRITVYLQDSEREGLIKLARQERREPRAQAAVLIQEGLVQHGILSETAVSTDSHIEGVQHANNPS